MRYEKLIQLKNGRNCLLRSATAEDAAAVLANFRKAHEETDYLLTYPEEDNFTMESEADFLSGKLENVSEVEICAIIDDKIVGLAGVNALGTMRKIRHRAELGIHIEKDFWNMGIGRALTKACIECARQAGYSQLELEVVADNSRALALYESEGFLEYGRNPRGFQSKYTGWQEVILMRKELELPEVL